MSPYNETELDGYEDFDVDLYDFDDDELTDGLYDEFDDDDDSEFDEFYDDEFDDDDDFGNDDDEYDDDDDGEIIGRRARIRRAKRRAQRRARRRAKKLGARRYKKGRVRTGRVRKRSFMALKKAVETNGKAISKVVKGVKANANSILKVNRNQARDIGRVNAKIGTLGKQLQQQQKNAQMQQMLSMFMKPELEEITLETTENNVTTSKTHKVTSSKMKDDNMILMLALSGGMGGSSGSNDAFGNPLILLALADKL